MSRKAPGKEADLMQHISGPVGSAAAVPVRTFGNATGEPGHADRRIDG